MNNYEKLKKIYDQIDKLLNDNSTAYTKDFLAWHQECKRFLTNTYGADSMELKNFLSTRFETAIINKEQEIWACKNGLEIVKTTFETLLNELSEEISSNNELNISDNKNKVFVVHGHDSELKYQVSYLLRKIGLTPIVLHEQTNSSRTIIEKIEKYGNDAGVAIVLFTPDDFGNVKSEEDSKPRARQNVVFEAGYFMGLLGRERTILVVSDKSIELPGDLQGVVYSEISELNIARELKAMGLNVNLNDLI